VNVAWKLKERDAEEKWVDHELDEELKEGLK